ncbi:MAG: YihY/virulence factor BrkB family protein [Treponema sp.]|jgi:uncharacterized BrkB/YihY/UPF0761 family membrane protein|nr:YihY/virulence factor BrkB family protein [Treponema sp.]
MRFTETLRRKAAAGPASAAQAIFICMDLFGRHGLGNHAAAGAYGLLFAAAPSLLIVAAALARILAVSPAAAAALIRRVGSLGTVFDTESLVGFFVSTRGGVAGVISLLSLFWTARIFALSLQRGLCVVLPREKALNPVSGTLVSLGIEVILILFIIAFLLVVIFGSSLVKAGESLTLPLSFLMVWVFVFCAYLAASVRRGRTLDALRASLWGSLFSVGCFILLFFLSRFIFNPTRYNALYGALGGLIIVLASVYFFFNMFYLGAALCYTALHFEALLFAKFSDAIASASARGLVGLQQRLFLSARGALKKYRRVFEDGQVLFYKGDTSKDVYFVISGEAAVYLDRVDAEPIALVGRGKFFGEINTLVSGGRSASVAARGTLETMMLSPALFAQVLKNDPATNSRLIAGFSERLKKTNERLKEA